MVSAEVAGGVEATEDPLEQLQRKASLTPQSEGRPLHPQRWFLSGYKQVSWEFETILRPFLYLV